MARRFGALYTSPAPAPFQKTQLGRQPAFFISVLLPFDFSFSNLSKPADLQAHCLPFYIPDDPPRCFQRGME